MTDQDHDRATRRTPLVDHHVHAFSNQLRAKMRPFVGEVPGSSEEDLIGAMDRDDVDRATLLSAAYMFGMPDAGAADAAGLSAENDWVGAVVDSHAGRLVGFFSVNPLLPSSCEEVERCASSGRFAGLKLHLANSALDLRDPEHVERLTAVLVASAKHQLPLAVHLRTRRPDYGHEDAAVFARLVADPCRGLLGPGRPRRWLGCL